MDVRLKQMIGTSDANISGKRWKRIRRKMSQANEVEAAKNFKPKTQEEIEYGR